MATAKKMKRKRVPWLPSSRSEWHVSQRRWQPTPTNPIYTSMMMSKVLCEHSRRSFLHQVLSSKRATVARDEVHHSVCCLLVVPRPARLSRGRPRPCSRRLPAKSAVFFFFFFFFENPVKSVAHTPPPPQPNSRKNTTTPHTSRWDMEYFVLPAVVILFRSILRMVIYTGTFVRR